MKLIYDQCVSYAATIWNSQGLIGKGGIILYGVVVTASFTISLGIPALQSIITILSEVINPSEPFREPAPILKPFPFIPEMPLIPMTVPHYDLDLFVLETIEDRTKRMSSAAVRIAHSVSTNVLYYAHYIVGHLQDPIPLHINVFRYPLYNINIHRFSMPFYNVTQIVMPMPKAISPLKEYLIESFNRAIVAEERYFVQECKRLIVYLDIQLNPIPSISQDKHFFQLLEKKIADRATFFDQALIESRELYRKEVMQHRIYVNIPTHRIVEDVRLQLAHWQKSVNWIEAIRLKAMLLKEFDDTHGLLRFPGERVLDYAKHDEWKAKVMLSNADEALHRQAQEIAEMHRLELVQRKQFIV